LFSIFNSKNGVSEFSSPTPNIVEPLFYVEIHLIFCIVEVSR